MASRLRAAGSAEDPQQDAERLGDVVTPRLGLFIRVTRTLDESEWTQALELREAMMLI